MSAFGARMLGWSGWRFFYDSIEVLVDREEGVNNPGFVNKDQCSHHRRLGVVSLGHGALLFRKAHASGLIPQIRLPRRLELRERRGTRWLENIARGR